MLGLLTTILPLTVLAAISPIVFLNASTVTANRGLRGGARFLTGNVLALGTLGCATMGLLGGSAADVAARELQSRRVDGVLGVVLLVYALWMLRRHVDDARSSEEEDGDALPKRGILTWGIIGMLTNFTTLPLYVSVAQRIGSSDQSLVVRLLTFVATSGIVLTPAWLPLVLARFAPDHATVGPQGKARVAAGTRVASIVACLVGATFLLWHAFA